MKGKGCIAGLAKLSSINSHFKTFHPSMIPPSLLASVLQKPKKLQEGPSPRPCDQLYDIHSGNSAQCTSNSRLDDKNVGIVGKMPLLALEKTP
ncbi:hypothetical protein O181_071758 [Austropuccinia psidii MF-1]|uniref:Uncharacterized protein n=1 Tax=Austropuccinia psidii MF-1 TaxID=1389203 RepID=A0A9Q3I8H0_9BASI|nr:hypothetical protein [Austropuccinia psidii MF-1]